MAKITLSESTYTLLPEGVTIFKVMSVDDSKYSDFGKLSVKLQTQDGKTHTESFALISKNGESNEGALRAWSYFARTCLDDYTVDEIDTNDIVGHYLQALVTHETYTRKTGDRAGEEAVAVRLKDYQPAKGFNALESATEDDNDDTDDFLDS